MGRKEVKLVDANSLDVEKVFKKFRIVLEAEDVEQIREIMNRYKFTQYHLDEALINLKNRRTPIMIRQCTLVEHFQGIARNMLDKEASLRAYL